MSESLNVLIVSKGHDYVHDSFLNMFAGMRGVTSTLVEQPAAQSGQQRPTLLYARVAPNQ